MIEPDDQPAVRTDSLVGMLAREDLDRLSVVELETRVLALEAETARTKAKLGEADGVRSAADALFRRG